MIAVFCEQQKQAPITLGPIQKNDFRKMLCNSLFNVSRGAKKLCFMIDLLWYYNVGPMTMVILGIDGVILHENSKDDPFSLGVMPDIFLVRPKKKGTQAGVVSAPGWITFLTLLCNWLKNVSELW